MFLILLLEFLVSHSFHAIFNEFENWTYDLYQNFPHQIKIRLKSIP